MFSGLQAVLTFALLAGAHDRTLEVTSVAVDLILPASLVSVSGGFPSSIWVLLLAGAFAVGLLRGRTGAWLGLLLGVGLAWTGLQVNLGSSLQASLITVFHLAILLPAAIVLARLADRSKRLLAGRRVPYADRDRWLARLLLEVEQGDRGISLDAKRILGIALEVALEALVEAGVKEEGLAGAAFERRGDWLEEVDHNSGSFQERMRVKAAKPPGDREAVVEAQLLSRSDSGWEELSPWLRNRSWSSTVRLDVPGNGESAGALVIGHRKGGAFNENSLELLRSFGNEVQLALRMASLYRALLSERDQFGEIQEEARKKLARDLHDGPTQVIAAIAMRTNFARRQLERDPEAASEELEKVEAMARSTTKEIRNMLFSLRPLILESQGLCAALGQYGDKVWDTHGQAVLLELNRDVENELSAEAQTALFYIVEEAVTNGLKHAAAGEILIRLFRADGEILLEVEDDGVGFNVGAVDANYEQRGSLGMVTMRERAQLLNATLHVWSKEGSGTRIQVRVPLTAEEEIDPNPSPEISSAP
jgi:signal transduction histidine kinase